MVHCKCVSLLGEYFPRPITEIIRLYAGGITSDVISAWFLENKLRIHRGILYCQYYSQGDYEKLYILIDATGFEVEFRPIQIYSSEVATWLQTIDDNLVIAMLREAGMTSRSGNLLVSDCIRFQKPEFISEMRSQLNRLGQRMSRQLIPVCIHDARISGSKDLQTI